MSNVDVVVEICRVLIKSACTSRKNSNPGKLELLAENLNSQGNCNHFANFSHGFENPPSRDGAKMQADFTNTLYEMLLLLLLLLQQQ